MQNILSVLSQEQVIGRSDSEDDRVGWMNHSLMYIFSFNYIFLHGFLHCQSTQFMVICSCAGSFAKSDS